MNDTAFLLPGAAELVLLALHLVVVGVTAVLAARRGRSPFGWAGLAFFVSVIATAVLLLLPRVTRGTVAL